MLCIVENKYKYGLRFGNCMFIFESKFYNMTTSELNKKIAESKEADWFKNVNITISYPHINFEQTFIGFSSIHKFIEQQIKGWDSYDLIPNEFLNSKKHFSSLKIRLENFINSQLENDENTLNSYWRNEETQLKLNQNFFTYDSPKTKFLINVFDDFNSSFQGAYNFIIGSFDINSRDKFIGALLAYEYLLKDSTDISKRRNSEKKSLNDIRTDLRNQLSDSQIDLTNHLVESKKHYDDFISSVDLFKSNKENAFNTWFEESKTSFLTFDSDSKNKISELEKTYEELLRLKKPAEYWSARAIKLKAEGWIAVRWLIGLVGFACATLYFLLWLTPDGMLLSFIKGQASAIKWSVIYITFISFLAYGIRALNKIAFSSFHLARDSEEREQLTYVYLSLIKDSAIDDKDKSLIMQSLFSRADTGLLKEDSSPTMPNDITGKIFGK